MHLRENRRALVLSGSGAQAAYEVGVLRAIAERHALAGLPAPFSIFCGGSAGALNAAGLALSADDLAGGVRRLTSLWLDLRVADVFQPTRRWLPSAAGLLFAGSKALLDNTLLGRRLEQAFDFTRLNTLIASQAVRALSITCFGYASGQAVSFFQGRADLEFWQHRSRVGAHVGLGAQHVLASMATPFLFPAVKLNREYFGDGGAREPAPLSPAVHLGAEQIVVIGAGSPAAGEQARPANVEYPNLAELVERMLSGASSLTSDIERLAQINRLLDDIPPPARAQLPWRPIDLLAIEPSMSLASLAADLMADLPGPVRSVLSRLGDVDIGRNPLASHLLFEPAYVEKLIDLGYRDALAKSDEISRFFAPGVD